MPLRLFFDSANDLAGSVNSGGSGKQERYRPSARRPLRCAA